MRVLYIGSFRLPDLDAAAARVLNVARSLRLAGHEVAFISWGGRLVSECQSEDNFCFVDGFPYVVTNEIDFKGGKIEKLLGWLFKGSTSKTLLRRYGKQFDCIIAYNSSLLRWLLSFCQNNGIQLISDITEWYAYKEQKIVERPLNYYNMHFLQKKVKNKIVISSFLNGYYKDSHNIIVPATCDISEEKWHQSCERAIMKVGVYNGITLIYAGNPARKDAVHYTINAVQRLVGEGSNLRFIIIGVERDNYLKNYKKMLSKKELSERIQFLGRVSQDDVPSYYALADFMVLLREQTRKSNAGFPTKFSESFSSGTPVIANLTSDLGEYLHDGKTGFIVSEPSEEAIYHTLKERVLPLDSEQIGRLKRNVIEASRLLDYHTYVEPLRLFMSELK